MKHVLIALCFLSLLTWPAGCATKDLPDENMENPEECTEIQSGTLSYSAEYRKWIISYHIPGTIDNINTYLISNPGKDYPDGSSRVEFCGKASLSEISPVMPGQTIYNIRLIKLVFIE
jgi:hypothetical protein